VSDVVVIGAGIVGCSAAAFLAEGGADVVVYDRVGIAAGASGRNSGVLQHPLDPALTETFEASLRLYRELDGFALADEPDGILMLGGTDADAALPVRTERVDDAHDLEPLVRPGTPAVYVDTGWIIGPRTATEAWARRAERAGARFVFGDDAPPPARRTLVATGAWPRASSPCGASPRAWRSVRGTCSRRPASTPSPRTPAA
jgi:glycine/D-amino acid oxidase-like deaminating enzyme